MTDRLPATHSAADAAYPTRLPLAIDRQVGAIARRVTNTATGFEILAADGPDAAMRALLVTRRHELRQSLAASDELWVAQHVAALLGSRPGGSDDAVDRERIQRIYIHTLAKKPRFALEKAFDDAHSGRIGLPSVAPTPAEIALTADRHATWVHVEMTQLSKIVDAKVIDIPVNPELRRKAVAAIGDVVDGIRRAGEEAEAQRVGVKWTPPTPRVRETSQEALDRLKDQPMPSLSATLKRTLGIGKQQQKPSDWRDEDQRAVG